MFQPGQLVVYGGEGVCRVVDVGIPDLSGMKTTRTYYTLCPVGRNVTVYVPTDKTDALRPVMTADQAKALIRRMLEIEPLPVSHTGPFMQRDSYEHALHSHERTDLVRIIKTVYHKQHPSDARQRQPGRIDEEYRKRAENILYSEFSAALGIPFEDVPAYICKAVQDNA